MDISGIETSGGRNTTQFDRSGNPVPGGGQGQFMFEPGQAYLPENFNPYSATESAQLAKERITGGNLNNWGVPQDVALRDWGKYWGSLDNPNNNNGSMIEFYTPEELNPYISNKNWKF